MLRLTAISRASVTSMLHRGSRSPASDTWPTSQGRFGRRVLIKKFGFETAIDEHRKANGWREVSTPNLAWLRRVVHSLLNRLEKALAAEALAIRRIECLGFPNRRKHRTREQRFELQSTCRPPFLVGDDSTSNVLRPA
jgi:hypothetical protein